MAWLARDVSAALPGVIDALKSDPAFIQALKVTVADALAQVDTSFLENPDVEAALGAMVSTVVTDLVGSTAVQTFIGDRIGPPFGSVVVSVLASPGFSQQFGTAVGSAVIQFLTYPGFNTVLLGTIDQFADAVLDGTAPSVALKDALAALPRQPGVQSGDGRHHPGGVAADSEQPAFREAMAAAVKTLVIDYLQQNVIKNKFLDGIVGQVAAGTVDSLLGRPPVDRLIDTIVVDVLSGMPLADVKPSSSTPFSRNRICRSLSGCRWARESVRCSGTTWSVSSSARSWSHPGDPDFSARRNRSDLHQGGPRCRGRRRPCPLQQPWPPVATRIRQPASRTRWR